MAETLVVRQLQWSHAVCSRKSYLMVNGAAWFSEQFGVANGITRLSGGKRTSKLPAVRPQ